MDIYGMKKKIKKKDQNIFKWIRKETQVTDNEIHRIKTLK